MRLGAAARATRLEAEAKKAAGEASAAWAKLSGPAKACEGLDVASRAECAKTVDAFVARAEALKVTLTAGDETVTTKCGTARPAFGAESRTVAVAELGEAKAQAARLKAVAAAVKAANATAPSTPVTTATDPLVDTGTAGFGDEVVAIRGLHDLTGNVWEWAWDWYGDYPGSEVLNPTGAPFGSYRVHRGGSWNGEPSDSRVGDRDGDASSARRNYLGFRLARSLQ